MKNIILSALIVFFAFSHNVQGQSSKSKSFVINNKTVVSAQSEYNLFNPALQSRILPKPNPGADKAIVEKVKNELAGYRKMRNQKISQKNSMVADPLTLLRNFNGNAFNFFVPNDNDMAISNHDE